MGMVFVGCAFKRGSCHPARSSIVGDWDDHRECHIGGDFLLTYKLVESAKHDLIVFVRTGTHAELFD